MEVLIQNFSYITWQMLVMWGIGGLPVGIPDKKGIYQRTRLRILRPILTDHSL